jgi:hypothetical protein
MFGEDGSHIFYATHASILTPVRSNDPYKSPSPPTERSPTIDFRLSLASVVCLSPVVFSAQPRLTSGLLRTL